MTDMASKNRHFTGVLLMAVSALLFFWFTWVDESFSTGDDAILRNTFLGLGILLGLSGLFLVAGLRLAARVYAGIGLAEPPGKAARGDGTANASGRLSRSVAVALFVIGLWHLSIGWLFFPTASHLDADAELYQVVVFGLIAFGLLPLLLSPFVSRGKPWALWTLFAFCTMICVGVSLAARATPAPSQGQFGLQYTRTINEGAIMYLIVTGMMSLLALGVILVQHRARKRIEQDLEASPTPRL